MGAVTPARLRRRPPRLLAPGRRRHDEPEIDGLFHALQCGRTCGRRIPTIPELAVAGLVHDIADIAFPHDHGDHDGRGAELVGPLLGARVARLVGAHVVAKRYLVATDPAYRSQLSLRSIETLQLQGDALDAAEISRLAADPDLDAILALRRADEAAKDITATPPGLDTWRTLLEAGRAVRSSTNGLRRRRRRRRPQRPRRRGPARAAGRGHGAGTALAGRRRGDDRAAVGPEFNVTALSYVVSLMPPTIVRELELAPRLQDLSAARLLRSVPRRPRAADPDDDPARRRDQIAQFSKADADAFERWDAWLGSLADVLGPLLTTIPPRVGSRRPRDLVEQLQLAWKLRGLGVDGTADVTRLFTMSIADLLDEYFDSPQMQGVLAVSGVIGTWAGPRSAGTAYVMAHHKIGDVGDGQLGSWGFPEGGMGGVSRALRDAAVANGATVRTDAPVARIDVRNGRVRGVTLESGEELRADVVVAATHPKITFLRAPRPRPSCPTTSSSASSAGGRAAAR